MKIDTLVDIEQLEEGDYLLIEHIDVPEYVNHRIKLLRIRSIKGDTVYLNNSEEVTFDFLMNGDNFIRSIKVIRADKKVK